MLFHIMLLKTSWLQKGVTLYLASLSAEGLKCIVYTAFMPMFTYREVARAYRGGWCVPWWLIVTLVPRLLFFGTYIARF